MAFIACSGINAQVAGTSGQYNRAAVISSPDEAIKLLVQGNKRFADEAILSDQLGKVKRAELFNHGQHPFAVIVSCSDSRVPPELVFDQGIGDLFVIRVAGNVVDSVAMGSIEYAVEHLHSPLVMVLGHENCGAVIAALEGGETSGSISSIIRRINPAVESARKAQPAHEKLLDQSIIENVNRNVQIIGQSLLIREATDHGDLKVIGATYYQTSGLVEMVGDPVAR